jgi:hypothetical protein
MRSSRSRSSDLTVRAGVRTVVAAEASREIVVAEVVRMDTPSHLHFRKDIAQINVGNGIGRLHPNIGDDHVDFLTLEVLQSLRRGWSFAHLVPGVVQVFRA